MMSICNCTIIFFYKKWAESSLMFISKYHQNGTMLSGFDLTTFYSVGCEIRSRPIPFQIHITLNILIHLLIDKMFSIVSNFNWLVSCKTLPILSHCFDVSLSRFGYFSTFLSKSVKHISLSLDSLHQFLRIFI